MPLILLSIILRVNFNTDICKKKLAGETSRQKEKKRKKSRTAPCRIPYYLPEPAD